MSEQQRRQPQQEIASVPMPQVSRSRMFDQRPAQEVRILAGAQVQEMALAGQTVGEARSLAETVFAVDPGAQAFVDGRRVGNDHVLESGQELEFVKRTGEKGADPLREFDDDDLDIAEMLETLRDGQPSRHPGRVVRRGRAVAVSQAVSQDERAPEAGASRSSRAVRGLTLEVTGDEVVWRRGTQCVGRAGVRELAQCVADGARDRERWCVYPRGVRLMAERDDGDVAGVVIEMQPGPRRVGWISDSSPRPCGTGARYTVRRLSFPWIVLVVVFEGGELTDLQQVFYRTQPLGSSADALYYSNLLNCMPSSHGLESKLCLRKLPGSLRDLTWEERVSRVTKHFWEASFNRSADIDERKSFYWTGGDVDARLATVASWERATEDRAYFTLDLAWRKAPFTLGETLERMLDEVAPRPEIDRVEDLVTAIERRRNGA